MDVIRPPDRTDIGDRSLIFLGGPIQGAPVWHEPTIDVLRAKSNDHPGLVVASPRRLGKMKPISMAEREVQYSWEHAHLIQPMLEKKKVVVLFNLVPESEHDCDRAYGQTSRFELGFVSAVQLLLGGNVVVAIHDGFSNATYLRYSLQELAPGVTCVYHHEQACEIAVQLALRGVS